MKFLRFLCNLLMFIGLTFGISMIQVGIYDITAGESQDVDGIYPFTSSSSKVAYGDSYTFWVTDIKTNLEQDAKIRVQSWVDAKFWRTCTGWIDKSIDFVVGCVKPIVVPVAQVNAVMTYYDRDINYFYQDIVKSYNTDPEQRINIALYEAYVLYPEFVNPHTPIENIYCYNSLNYNDNAEDDVFIPISEFDYENADEKYKSLSYYAWVGENSALYNHNWKLNKYNCGSYSKYYTKFISDIDGQRHLKTAVVVLYYQQYVSILLALIFTIKYPITFVQAKITGKRRIRFGRKHEDLE